jgi:hypothetical protein
LSFAVMLQEKPRPWLGVRGEAEIIQDTFAEEASAPKQFGARRLVPLPDKESPAEAGPRVRGSIAEGGYWVFRNWAIGGRGGWFLGGEHSVSECCRRATEGPLLICSPPNAN